ncbi:MAG TPA: NMD3-related protein [Methanomassiliicoccales archaeon]|nr:NMD3-related protein [Methanomassiliicoccales archaeon]
MSFCVKCGADGPTYKSLCESCFLEGKVFTILPDHVDVFNCCHCDDYLLGGKWMTVKTKEEVSERATELALNVIKDAQVLNVALHAEKIDDANYQVNMTIGLSIEGLEVDEDRKTIVRFKNTSCPRCNKLMGNYYEGTLQVRTRDRKMPEDLREEIMDRILKMMDEHMKDNRELFISKINRLTTSQGGIDVILSSSVIGRNLAHHLADQYAAEVKETAKLVTQKQGKDLYRVTFVVRLPAYRFGDLVEYEKKLYLVGALRSNSTKLTNMKTTQGVMVSNSDMISAKVVGRKEDLIEAVILTETDREVQVMHPTSFKVFDLKKPPKFERKGDTVKVFQYNEEFYLLPLQG